MGNDPKTLQGSVEQVGSEPLTAKDPFLIDEFDIIELEDRLELTDRCNSCQPDKV